MQRSQFSLLFIDNCPFSLSSCDCSSLPFESNIVCTLWPTKSFPNACVDSHRTPMTKTLGGQMLAPLCPLLRSLPHLPCTLISIRHSIYKASRSFGKKKKKKKVRACMNEWKEMNMRYVYTCVRACVRATSYLLRTCTKYRHLGWIFSWMDFVVAITG